jgi:hypothetical protein
VTHSSRLESRLESRLKRLTAAEPSVILYVVGGSIWLVRVTQNTAPGIDTQFLTSETRASHGVGVCMSTIAIAERPDSRDAIALTTERENSVARPEGVTFTMSR